MKTCDCAWCGETLNITGLKLKKGDSFSCPKCGNWSQIKKGAEVVVYRMENGFTGLQSFPGERRLREILHRVFG